MSRLNVVGIQLKNVMGVEELTITPTGNIIQLTGGNGKGKSSILEGIKGALGISEHSSLIREGEKKAEIVLDLGDMLIKKTYTASGAKLDIQGKVMGTDSFSSLSKPANILKSLINPNSVDPIKLLSARPKELLDCVLEAIPMRVNGDRMADITGKVACVTEEHALAVIGNEAKDFTEKRRDANRDLKAARTTKEQLLSTIVTGTTTVEEIEEQIAEKLEQLEALKLTANRASRSTSRGFSSQIEVLDAENITVSDQILDLQLRKASIKEQRESIVREMDLKAEAAYDLVMQGEQGINLTIAYLREDVVRTAVTGNTRKQAEAWQGVELSRGLDANKYDAVLTALQAYKEELCQNLPIKGLAITDGMLSMNNIQFGMMNTAARVDLVIELAKLSAGKLGIIILDDAEHLDPETYALFLEKAAQTDLTFVVARVTKDELAIN